MNEKHGATLGDYIRIARPDHWIKNLFILPGTAAAAVLSGGDWTPKAGARVVLALAATCLVASANYVINEWLDAKFDRFHPTKKSRPVVVSDLRRGPVLLEYAGLAAAGLALSALLGPHFFAMAAWLFAMGVVYNVEPLRTKDVPFLDVLSESVNNMIRLLMGWFVLADATLPPCSLVLGYWMCGAFLMAIKRFAEYRMIGDPDRAGLYRKSFRRYTESSLLVSAFVYALAATFLIGIFLVKYRIEMLLCMPLLFALFGKYMAISYKEDSAAQKPEKLYREKELMLLATLFVLALAVACCVRLPLLGIFTTTELVRIP